MYMMGPPKGSNSNRPGGGGHDLISQAARTADTAATQMCTRVTKEPIVRAHLDSKAKNSKGGTRTTLEFMELRI